MKILILTLCGQRDTVVDNLIAGHLRNLGHEVHVHSFAKAGFQSVLYMKPDVVVAPFPGGEFKHEFVRRCKKCGCTVIVRRGEAGVSKKVFETLDDNYKAIILGNWDYSPYVDLELTWGQEFTDIVDEQGHMPPRKLKACGAFAFDVYLLPETLRDENHKKTVLFATGFACADYTAGISECGLPDKSSYHQVLYERERKARDTWIASIKELARWFGEQWRLTLKVRPGEQITEYKKELGDIVGIYPACTSSLDALKETDVLVHSGSTMAIEAHLLDIPSFNFCNVNPDSLLASVSPRLETYDELEWNLARADVLRSNINEGVFCELQEHLYGKIDGMACERAAKYIHEHIKDKEIETDIPNEWPKDAKFIEDGVHIKKRKGDVYWACLVCKEIYYAKKGKQVAKCPYCGVQIKRKLVEVK